METEALAAISSTDALSRGSVAFVSEGGAEDELWPPYGSYEKSGGMP
jgi:hypothetical protein